MGPGDVGRGWPGDVGSHPVPAGSPRVEGARDGLKKRGLGSAVWDGGTREGRGAGAVGSRWTRGLSILGCSPQACGGQLEDLSLGQCFFLPPSDERLARALKHKCLYPNLYLYLSKGSWKCSHYYLCKCLILSFHPPHALGTGDIF